MDGKSYAGVNDPDERQRIRGWVHHFTHQGLSIREVQGELEGKGIKRSVGSISNDLKTTRCPGCSGGEIVHLNTEREEKDMHGDEDGALIDGGEVESAALTADEVETMRSTALAGGSNARATAAPREPDPTFVNWKWAVLADLLKRQTTDDLNSDEPTIHEEAFYEVLEFIARNYDPHPNDQFEQGGSIIEGVYNLVSGYLVGDLWHKPDPSPAVAPDRP